MTLPPSSRFATAGRYWRAAHKLLERGSPAEFFEPVNYLLAMALELTLKAFLAQTGKSPSFVRRAGHDLETLLRHCVEVGFPISQDDATVCLLAAEAHREHFFRYGPQKFDPKQAFIIQLAEPRKLLAAIARLLDMASGDPAHVRGKRFQDRTPISWPGTLLDWQPLNAKSYELVREAVQEQALRIGRRPS